MRIRRNSDRRLRELERAAATGDPEAVLNLMALRIKSGLLETMTLEDRVVWRRALADSLPRNVQTLEEIGDFPRRRGAEVQSARAGRWGWFPHHADNLRCPRGHVSRIPVTRDEGYGPGDAIFRITNGCVHVEPTVLNDDGAFIIYEDPDLAGQAVALDCGACGAHWPLENEVDFWEDMG